MTRFDELTRAASTHRLNIVTNSLGHDTLYTFVHMNGETLQTVRGLRAAEDWLNAYDAERFTRSTFTPSTRNI